MNIHHLPGLSIVHSLLHKFSMYDPSVAGEFFKSYFLDLMQHVLAVVTDTSHTARESELSWCVCIVL